MSTPCTTWPRDDMWFVAVCGCDWEGPPCPDPVTAANFWGQHLLAVAASKQEAPEHAAGL